MITQPPDTATSSRSSATSRGVTLADVGVALGVTAVTMVGTADAISGAQPGVEGYLLMAVAGMVLAWRRRWPLAVFAVSLVAMLTYFLRGHPEGLVWLPATVAVGSFTVVHGWRRASGLVALCVVLASSDDLFFGGGGAIVDIETVAIVLGLGCSVAVGEWHRTRRAWIDEIEARAADAEAARHQEAARKVSDERLRIAREVHDGVAHALASINVQAGVGEHLGHRDPGRSQAILGSIRVVSQDALDDLRATVGRLRSDGDATEPPASPGLAELDRLVSMARDAGLSVDLRVDGRLSDLPREVDLAAYRIVQESITNAIKHAGDARVEVVVSHREGTVRVMVADDGTGCPDDPSHGEGGHGLAGMRERAEQLRGTLQAGPAPSGGFRVVAELPVRMPA